MNVSPPELESVEAQLGHDIRGKTKVNILFNDPRKNNRKRMIMVGGVICLLPLAGLVAGFVISATSREREDTASASSIQEAEVLSEPVSTVTSSTPSQHPTNSPTQNPTKEPTLPPGWEEDVMPNIGFLLRGYDLAKGNPTPTSSAGVAKTDPGFQLPIFAATYSSLKKTPDLRFSIPDSIEAVSCSGGCNLNFATEIIESSQEYIDRLSVKVKYQASGTIKIIKASFSASVDYQQLSQRINEQRQFATASEASCCVYEAEISSYATPAYHPTFLAALSALTGEYDQAIYRRFIREFGTHYVKKATMGAIYGQQSFLTWEKRSELEQKDIDVKVAAEASVLKLVEGGWSVDVGISKKDLSEFESSREHEALYTRGALPPSDGNINTWFKSVGRDPAPISLEIERIDSLDLPVSNQVKANLEAYLNSYCEDLVAEDVIESCEVPTRGCVSRGTWCNSLYIGFAEVDCADCCAGSEDVYWRGFFAYCN